MKNIQNFFAHNFAIRRQDFDSLMGLVAPCLLRGKPQAAAELLDDDGSIGVRLLSPHVAGSWEPDDPEAPDGCLALISLSGFLFSHTTDRLMAALNGIEADERVLGVVLAIDGPGGHATRVELAARRIREFGKPVATVVMGMMCSAHFWIGTAAERTFASSPLCQVGSVGAFTQYVGLKEYFRKMGVDYREIYPDSSDLKNHESRAISENDDEQPMKDTLQRLHSEFARDVALQMGISYDPAAEVFRGKVFFADEAVQSGYIDAMGTLNDAFSWTYARGVAEKVNRNTN